MKKYYIKYKNLYLLPTRKNNSYVTPIKGNAFWSTDLKKAQNLLSCLPKTIRHQQWSIVEEDGEMEKSISPLSDDISQKFVVKTQEKKSMIQTILNHMEEIASHVDELESTKSFLLQEQMRLDQMISDAEHYLEFYPISASDGYKLAKIIQDARRERRKVKDDLYILEILKTECKEIVSRTPQSKIAGMATREYRPRVLTDLFLNKNK